MGQKVTAEDIHMVVTRFWDVFRAKSEEQLRELYSHNSTAFEVAGVRNEPGKLGAARRAREYFHPGALFDVQIGPVDVILLGEEAAVSSYTFKFQAKQRARIMGKLEEEKFDVVRATHVWRAEEGKLRIIHEHFSA